MHTNDTTTPYSLDQECQILAAAERILHARLIRLGKISSPAEAADYLRSRCAHLDREVFGAMFLDARHQILATEHLFHGTVDGAEVHPRVLAKRALELNAVAVVVFHNHPSGNPDVSAADRAVTSRLKQSLGLLDIRLLDSFVVTAATVVSMAEKGML